MKNNSRLLKTKNLLIRSGILILVFNGSYNTKSIAQKNNLQSWNSVSAKIPLSKKTDLSISQFASFSPGNNFQLNFTQTQLRLNYEISKIFSVMAGDQLNYLPGSTNSLRNRVFIRGTVENKFSRLLKAEHAMQVEFHNKNEHRYSRRFIFINELSTKKRFSVLRLRPSASYWLYYNQGGTPMQYYDKTGAPTVSQTPDGLHRGRLFLTLNSKISNHFRLSAYYLIQQEFNLFTSENRNINVANPGTGKISRAYDDFNAIGLSLQVVFGKD